MCTGINLLLQNDKTTRSALKFAVLNDALIADR